MASFLTRFFGRTASEGAAFALGVAVGPALSPAVRELVNAAWNRYPTMPLQAIELAQGVASGQINRTWATNEAQNTGVDTERFNALIQVFDAGPGIARAFDLLHRGLLDEAEFRRALKRESLEQEWIEALWQARQTLLTPAELANARQQGYIGEARQKSEAAKWGIDDERAELQFLLSGLPPGVERGLRMARRGIINRAQFGDVVQEGHEKTKYTDEEWALFWEVVNAATYAELHLKGRITEAEMNEGGALTGYRPEDMQRLFWARGRPATTHQAFIGVRRGGTYDGPTAGIPDYFQKAVRQSNIRDEWLNLLWAQRYSYPSAFVLRGLTQSGDLTEAEAHDILLKVGWEPKLAASVAARWAGGGSATADPHIEKARTQLWTTQHTSYKSAETNDADAKTTFDLLAIPSGAQTQILRYWKRERAIVRKQLTPTQIRKAYKKAVLNPATGRPWTREDAFARLVEIGMSSDDANTFLDE